MAVIAFLIDTQEGHLFPAFGMSSALKKRGHSIIYLSTSVNEERIRRAGFNFYRISKVGVAKSLIEQSQDWQQHEGHVLQEMIIRELDPFMEEFQPNIVVVSSFIGYDALLFHYRYKIDPILFTPCLKDNSRKISEWYVADMIKNPGHAAIFMDLVKNMGIDISSLGQIAETLNSFHELIACPVEFQASERTYAENVHYLGPMIKPEDGLAARDILDKIPPDKKVLYASLGSQVPLYGKKAKLFFQNLINVMRSEEMQTFHLILSIGRETDEKSLHPVPENVTMMHWAPQTAILRYAKMAIVHGGLGTIKECLYYGVPMLLFPLVNDQPMNARVVENNKLGVMGKMEMATTYSLKKNILSILGDKAIREAMNSMQAVFQQKQETDFGIGIIETLCMSQEIQSAVEKRPLK